MMNIEIRKAEKTDMDLLLSFARENFILTYYHLNDPSDMDAYLEEAFSEDTFQREFEHPESDFYCLKEKNRLIGYYKINYGEAQTEPEHPNAAELERVYVAQSHKGRGLGRMMINHAIEQSKDLQYLWLGVWKDNEAAIGFYKNLGFEDFGTHIFHLGNDPQEDLILRIAI
jgi:ribosomal protein S18 acetylase RimI-like enzyme